MEENLQINDISNETGNIGQNQSVDSLFQPTGSNNLDLTFIDTAMTPLAEPKEPTVSQPKKPTTAAEYWDRVSRGAPGLGIMARAAGGDSGDGGSDGDDSDDSGDVDSGWAGKGNEAFEKAFEKASKMNKADKAEADKAEAAKAKADRAKAEREAHESEHSSGGETDNSPTDGSESSDGGGSGSAEYSNEADIAYSEVSRTKAASTVAMGEAQEAYNTYKTTLANEKQAEANVKTATEKLQEAREVVKQAEQVANKANAEALQAKQEADKLVDNIKDNIQNIVDSKKTTGEIVANALTMGIYGAVTDKQLENIPGAAINAGGNIANVAESVVNIVTDNVTGVLQGAMEAGMHGTGNLAQTIVNAVGGRLAGSSALSMPVIDGIANVIEGAIASAPMAAMNMGAVAAGDVTTNMAKQDRADIMTAGLEAAQEAIANGATAKEAGAAAMQAMIDKQAEITGIDDVEYNTAVLTNNLNGGNPNSGGFAEVLTTIGAAASAMEIAQDKSEEARVARVQANAASINNDIEALEAQAQQAQQELVQAQQAHQEALATATQAVQALEQANAAAEAALNKYVEASKGAVDAVKSAKARMNAPIDDNSSYNADPGDSETTADALVIPDDIWSREIKEVPDPLKGTPLGDCLQEFYDIFNNYNSEINVDAYQHWWNDFITYMKSIWGASNKSSFLSKVANTVQGVWSALKAVKSIFKGRTEGHIVEFGKRCLSLLLNVGIAIMTGGASIPVQTSVTIIKQLWKNLKNDVVDSDLNQILENPNSEGGDYEYYDTYKAIADDADAKWQLPAELGENYVAGKRSNNYSDYNYGLESDDKQKGQLYSDEDVKGFITKVYRKSPTIYKLKLN